MRTLSAMLLGIPAGPAYDFSMGETYRANEPVHLDFVEFHRDRG